MEQRNSEQLISVKAIINQAYSLGRQYESEDVADYTIKTIGDLLDEYKDLLQAKTNTQNCRVIIDDAFQLGRDYQLYHVTVNDSKRCLERLSSRAILIAAVSDLVEKNFDCDDDLNAGLFSVAQKYDVLVNELRHEYFDQKRVINVRGKDEVESRPHTDKTNNHLSKLFQWSDCLVRRPQEDGEYLLCFYPGNIEKGITEQLMDVEYYRAYYQCDIKQWRFYFGMSLMKLEHDDPRLLKWCPIVMSDILLAILNGRMPIKVKRPTKHI